jgi:hypothetical protein
MAYRGVDGGTLKYGISDATPTGSLKALRWDGTGFSAQSVPYASFSDSTIQTIASTSVAYPITFNTDDIKSGITHSTVTNPSYITFPTAGVYSLFISAIVDLTSGTGQHIEIWGAIDGTNIANSNTIVQIPNASSEMTLAVDLLITVTANQRFEWIMRADSTNVRLLSTAAAGSPTRPACPSVICIVKWVSG